VYRVLVGKSEEKRPLGRPRRRNEMDGACSADRGGERRVQGFDGETLGKETTGVTQA
jgi:hypothetical protein